MLNDHRQAVPPARSSPPTLYEILQVPADASGEAIAAAYQRAQERLDLQGHDEETRNQRMLLQDAYSRLQDPQRRRAYDLGLLRKARPAAVSRRERHVTRWWLVLALVMIAGLAHERVGRSWIRSPASLAAVAPEPHVAGPAPLTASWPTLSAPELYRGLAPSAATILIEDAYGQLLGSGSGVIVGRGQVITNCHVAKSGATLKVQTLAGVYVASIETADDQYDLCRLRVPAEAGPAVTIRSSSELLPGETTYALGAPRGLSLSLSAGILAAVRTLKDGGHLLQTTAAIAPGSSGGGLFDAQGRLIGITTYQYTQGQGINFAVAADLISSMQQRDAGHDSVGSLTLGSEEPILGSWSCFDPVGGTNLEMNFAANGHLILQIGDKRGVTAYHLQAGVLSFQTPGRSLDGRIEGLDKDKMVLNYGGQRLACTRH